MMLYAVAIVLLHTFLLVQATTYPFQKSLPANDIEALCADKPVDLFNVSEIESLESIVGESSCSSNVKTAILDLVNLIKQTKNDLCARESIDNLREFYSNYLDTSSTENKHRQRLPGSLKKVVLAYGMQMSNLCKKRMVDEFTDSENLANVQANRVINGLVNNNSPLAQILEGLVGPDEILLPSDLDGQIRYKQGSSDDDDDDNDDDEDKNNIIFVQSATAPFVRIMQDECNQIFAPIYRPVIEPVVKLANMGFNYKDQLAKERTTQMSEDLIKWSRLVFLCEALNSIQMVDVPETSQLSEEFQSAKTVRILTKDEAIEIGGANSVSRPNVIERASKQVVYESDLIINKADKKLTKAVHAFKTSKSEDEKLAKRMMAKGITMLKSQLKQFKIGLLVSTGYKALVRRLRNGEKPPPRVELAKALTAAIAQASSSHDDANNPIIITDPVTVLGADFGGNFLADLMLVMYIAVIGMLATLLLLTLVGV